MTASVASFDPWYKIWNVDDVDTSGRDCVGVDPNALVAKKGRIINIRKIGGLDAIYQAVGRATEMGDPFILPQEHILPYIVMNRLKF